MSTDDGRPGGANGNVTGAPTLEDVARAAGVSRATASRAINGGALVSQETRDAVTRAVVDLGYAPNQAARMLVTKRSGVLGVLVPETDLRVFSDPFFASVYHGVASAFTDHDAQVVLAMSKPGQPAETMLSYLTSGRIDGAVIVSHHGTDLARATSRLTQPVVFIGDPGVGGLPYVDVDSVQAAQVATRHLIGQGCRRITTITGAMDMPAGRQRQQGFLDALAEAGLEPAGVAHGNFTDAGGRTAARELLEASPDLDGIFAASDLMAAGAMRVLSEAGYRVPADVRVVGFDDSEASRQTTPPLTTMTGRAHEMARIAGRMLRNSLAGRPFTYPVILNSELVPRASA